MKSVIYARYSSADQREESIEGQLRECREYAERKGYCRRITRAGHQNFERNRQYDERNQSGNYYKNHKIHT